ncbi:hypothetical protein FHX35_002244 [Auritidibacter ignavus]|nr:hypothetical protein [Auritidibacter ignavus]
MAGASSQELGDGWSGGQARDCIDEGVAGVICAERRGYGYKRGTGHHIRRER